MARIRLTLRELNLIADICKNINWRRSVLVEFNSKEVDDIIESIGTFFVSKGLKKYEPNALGIELENIQDKFLHFQQENG